MTRLFADPKRGKEEVQSYLAAKNVRAAPPIVAIEDNDVRSVFPWHAFLFLRYPQYQNEWLPPRGWKHGNLFAVAFRKDGQTEFTHIQSLNQLKTFFKTEFVSEKGVPLQEARAVMSAWMTLSEGLRSDGHYGFRYFNTYLDLRGSGRVPQVPTLTGVAVVNSGGRGQVQVTIDFNSQAQIEQILELGRIHPGRRPRR